MKTHIALRCVLLIVITSFCSLESKAQFSDTTVFLYKFSNADVFSSRGQRLVASMDSADFVRVVPPYKLSDPYVEVTEFYKNKKLKLSARAITASITKYGSMQFDGTCIDFFPTGKRRSVSNFVSGVQAGLQYYYYPEGKLFEIINYKVDKWDKNDSYGLLVDFYDAKGVQICKDGNGRAIEYAADYYKVKEGPVKNGKMEGEWTGLVNGRDAAKYSLFYKNGRFVSGIGYDVAGSSYAFKTTYTPTYIPSGLLYFLSDFRKRIKLPKQSLVTQKMIDSVQLYFLVEKDGSLTHFETVEEVSPDFFESLKAAFLKCPKWKPARLYGIPLQTQVAVSLDNLFRTDLYNGIPLGSLPTMRAGTAVF